MVHQHLVTATSKPQSMRTNHLSIQGKKISDNVAIAAIPTRLRPHHALENIHALNVNLASLTQEEGIVQEKIHGKQTGTRLGTRAPAYYDANVIRDVTSMGPFY